MTASSSGDEVNLLDLAIAVLRHKKLIAVMTGLAAIISAVAALLMPNLYTATSVLMPPQQQASSTTAMLGQIGALVGFAPASLGVKNPNDLYVGILKSRTIADALIKSFELQKLYEKDTLVETRKELSERTSVTTGKEGLIFIEVDDHDAKRASDIANAYVAELERLTSTLAVTEAAQRRLFFERQLGAAKEDLVKAEVSFKEMQEKTGLVQLDQQGRAMIEAVATLRAQIVAKQVELSTIRTFATEANPLLLKAQQELSGLRAELRKLERQAGVDADLLVGTREIPAAGLQYARAYRDLKYAETIFELMAKQFEMARVEEARDAIAVQVVDRAIPPDEKSKPRRALIVVICTFVSAILSILIAIVLATWLKPDDSDASKVDEFRRLLGLRAR